MSTTVCKKCNGVGMYKSDTLAPMALHCHDCNGLGEIKQSITDKEHAAIKTLEQLGYEYCALDQWKIPVNGDISNCGNHIYWRTSEEVEQIREKEEPKPTTTCTTCTKQKNDIISEYLAGQQDKFN